MQHRGTLLGRLRKVEEGDRVSRIIKFVRSMAVGGAVRASQNLQFIWVNYAV
jgi:hypothetical protein